MKTTRENLNSFDHSVADICEYFRDLVSSGGEPTPLETFAMGFLALKDARFNELFAMAPITHTEKPQFTPEFNSAMEKYQAMLDDNDGIETDEARDQFMKAMLLAPDWFSEMAMEEAKAMGLIPKASHCLDNGEPVFSLEQMAEHLGISIEDAHESLNKLVAQREELGLETPLVNPSIINKIQ